MAKIHYSYEDVVELYNKYPIHKPGGTLGWHNLEILNVNGQYVARGIKLNKNYDHDLAKYVLNYNHPKFFPISEFVFIKEKETLVYDCGRVWVLPDPATLSPLKKIARLTKAKLIYLEEWPTLENIHTSYFWTVSREGIEISSDGNLDSEYLYSSAPSFIPGQEGMHQREHSCIKLQSGTFMLERKYVAGGQRYYTKGYTIYVKKGLKVNLKALVEKIFYYTPKAEWPEWTKEIK